MQRFDSWNLSKAGDFWTKKFKPSKLINTAAFINSALSQQLDSELLERYDINDISEHTPGTSYTWVKINLDKPIYDENSYPYCYIYKVDENWLYIDAIYDKHINPEISLQNSIDFSYKQGSGKLKCKKEIIDKNGTLPILYISKGWYAEYRVYNEIGHFLDYLEKDSTLYRDSIAPILASLYICPSYFYLLAVLNVMVGLPIAKYDGETILSIIDGVIKTDKYQYEIGTIHTHLNVGDTLVKFQPLTDVVELHTNEMEPKWWEGHPTAFFTKYTPGTILDDKLRNYIMENYLFDSVAGIEFRQDKLGLNPVNFNYQIRDIFLKAAPSHSDFLFAQSYHVGTSYDVYNLMTPTDDSHTIPRIILRSLFGRFLNNVPKQGLTAGQFGISSYLFPSPKINTTYIDGKSLKFSSSFWHLYNEYDAFNDSWKFLDTRLAEPKYKIFIEPWEDRVYLRQGELPLFKDSERKFIPEDLEERFKPTIFLEYGTPSTDSVGGKHTDRYSPLFSSLNNIGTLLEPNVPTNTSIPAFSNYSAQDVLNIKFPIQWTRSNVTGISKDSTFYITTEKRDGYVISPEINIGWINKILIPELQDTYTPAGGGLYMEYSVRKIEDDSWSAWTPVESAEKLYNINGKIKFKINLLCNTSILDGNPRFSGFRLTVNV